MRYAVPLVLLAGPAYAHHEIVTVSVLPGMVVWLTAIAAAGLGTWRRRRRRRKIKSRFRFETEVSPDT